MATVRPSHREFRDADDVTIHYSVWSPKKPVAIAQISHGQGDHRARYDALAQFLVARGFVVYADDHRGHGETGMEQWGGDPAKLGHPGPRGVRGSIDAINELTEIARADHPGRPLVFIGHSMGSLFGQIALDRGTLDADLIVWSGTALRTPFTMNAGNLNAKHAHLGDTGHEWLSRDTELHSRFLFDPFTFKANAMKQFGLLGALSLLGVPKKVRRHIPILILQGTDDSLGNEQSVITLADRYVRAGYNDVTLVLYDGARHEVYNETNRDAVFKDLAEWLTERLERFGR